jgi:hypothetical protein
MNTAEHDRIPLYANRQGAVRGHPGRIGLHDAVVRMQAVIEVPRFDAGSQPPWPVAAMDPWSWLVLDALDLPGPATG